MNIDKFGFQEFFIGATLLVLLIPMIIYLINLQNIFSKISIENRKMNSNRVWLILIPFFGLVWQFIVVNKLALSFEAEFRSKGISWSKGKPGKTLGIWYCILFCFLIFIPIFLAGIICWIIYWVNINKYMSMLESPKR